MFWIGLKALLCEFRSNTFVISWFQKTSRMQSSEKLCLKWNDFQENLNSAFGVLRNDDEFADVTLVSEDGTQIETHKVILVSSSPFFTEILKKNKHPHPLIYMRGIKSDELVSIVDFSTMARAVCIGKTLSFSLVLLKSLG